MAETASLRDWIDRPGRAVGRGECFHVFTQVVEAVGLAHSGGAAVGDLRPSRFVVSAVNRVALVGSDSWPASGVLEDEWYACPEGGGGGGFASDVYQLGVLLFELFCPCESMEEKVTAMSNLRHRVLPAQLLRMWPKEAAFCLWLSHPQPDMRPSVSDVLQSEFQTEPRKLLAEHRADTNIEEEIEEQELLLDFLSCLRKSKEEIAEKLHNTASFLSTDIEEVLNEQAIVQKKGQSFSELEEADHSKINTDDHNMSSSAADEASSFSVTAKRSKRGLANNSEVAQLEALLRMPNSGRQSPIQENILLKSSRLMKNLTKFEAAYLSTRCRVMSSAGTFMKQHHQSSNIGNGVSRTEASTIDSICSREEHSASERRERLHPFLEDLHRYLSFSKLKVRAELKHGDLLSSSNLVCSSGFDRDKEFFAIAGANRKIKIFECDTILNEDRDIHYHVVEMKNKSKVSCISWNNYIKNQIASSDFEGVAQVWDVSRSQVILKMKGHERRIWSVDFSPTDPMKLASGSDDGLVKLWNINQAESIGTIRTKANVCSVQFPPDSACSLAIGSADHNVYCYDLRNLRAPFCTLIGHTKTVSYVAYLDRSTILSASTDSSLKLWDLSTIPSKKNCKPLVTYTGHTNVKNFVGLSVYDGYIATGSETNEVFVYHKAFPMQVLSYKFDTVDPISGLEVEDSGQFVSSVCWRGQSTILLAANSSGNIKLLEMV